METFSCLDKWSGAGSARRKEKSILNVENDKLAFCSRAEEGGKKLKLLLQRDQA